MKFISRIHQRWQNFLHNDELKEKIYSIVFESDTKKGKLFDIILNSSAYRYSFMSEHKNLEKRKCPRCNRDGHDFEALYCKCCGAKLKMEKPREFVNERPNDERF